MPATGVGGNVTLLQVPSRPDPFASLVLAVAQTQDRTAFARLFDHFAPRVKSYLLRLGSSDGEAEEAMQEVMISLWRRAGSFDPRLASVSTWLFTIARNRRIDMIRRSRRPEFDPDDPVFRPDEAVDGADSLYETAEDARTLSVALRELPPEQADLIRKAYYEDKSHSAIADELALPLGTVKSRIRLALARLRGALKERR